MLLQIKQDKRELFSGHFIIYQEDEMIGSVLVNGKLISPKRSIHVNVFDHIFDLVWAKDFKTNKYKASMNYKIIDQQKEAGVIFQAVEMRTLINSFDYYRSLFRDHDYQMYSISLDEEGVKYPIYKENVQIALLAKPQIIYDDLYNYNLIISDENCIDISVLFMSYLYGVSVFKNGEMIKKGYRKTVGKTTNEELLSKYDKSFEQKYR